MFKFIACSFIAASLLLGSAAFGEDRKMPRLLSLSGHGDVKAKPDMAVVELGEETLGPTAKAALETNTKHMGDLLTLLQASGIDGKDVQTSGFAVGPRFDNPTIAGQAPKIIGYSVSNSVVVTVRKLDDLGGILDKAVTAGSNRINGVTFAMSDPQSLADQARNAAVKAALHKAQLFTDAAGVKLGALQSMNEGGVSAPMPMVLQSRAMSAKMASDQAMPVPVAQGQLEVSADVNMVWLLE